MIVAQKTEDGVHVEGMGNADLGWRSGVNDRDFDGLHAGWRWDGERLEAWTDDYGFYPLFYFEQGNQIFVSSSLSRLLEASGTDELDEDALSVFVHTRFFPGESTAYRHVRVLPPGGRLVWDGSLSVRGADVSFAPEAQLTRDAAIDAYVDTFAAAIRRSLPKGTFGVPLSGGKDSRHILVQLCHLGRPPDWCVTLANRPGTWNKQPDEDVAIARIVAARLGVPHYVIDDTSRRLEAEKRKNDLTHRLTHEHGWMIPLVDFVRDRSADTYDGIGGDVLSAGLFLTPERIKLYERREFTVLADRICQRHTYLAQLMPKRLRRRDDVVDWVAQELERHEAAANPIGSFFFWNRTRRTIALFTCCLLGSAAAVRTPYLDPDVFELLSSLPARMLNAEFHREAIRRAYPEHYNLPYRAPPQPADKMARHRLFAWELFAPALAPRRFVSKAFLVPRLVRCLCSRSYARTIDDLGPSAAYLMEL